VSIEEQPPLAGAASESTWRRHLALALTGAVLAVIIALAALSGTSHGRRVAASLGIRTQSEPYTAISFTEPKTLGSAGVLYDGIHVHDRLSFRIRNEEHRRITYRWRVSFSPAWRVHQGSVTVGSGQAAIITRRVLIPCNEPVGIAGSKPSRVQVRVQVSPSEETIDFWQHCGG
jgi:hypothetical protein